MTRLSSRRSKANGLDSPPSPRSRRSKEKKRVPRKQARLLREKKKSAEDKAEIAQNAQGVQSRKNLALFPGEDHAAYAALHNELKKLHRPETPFHFEVVNRATALIWRLRRIPAFEAAVFNSTARSLECLADPSSSPEAQSADVGLVLSEMLRTDAFSKIAQYEATLRDQLQLVYKELDEILDWHFKFDHDRGSIGFVEEEAPEDPPW